jgi:hypothetical protein
MHVKTSGDRVVVEFKVSVHKTIAAQVQMTYGYAANSPISTIQVFTSDVNTPELKAQALAYITLFNLEQRLKRLAKLKDDRQADEEEVDVAEEDPRASRHSRKVERITDFVSSGTTVLIRKIDKLPTLEELPSTTFDRQILHRLKSIADNYFLVSEGVYADAGWVTKQVEPHLEFANQQLEKVLARLQNFGAHGAPQTDDEFIKFILELADIRAELVDIRKMLREKIRRSLRIFFDKPELSKVVVRMAYNRGPLGPIKLFFYAFHSSRSMLVFSPETAETAGRKLPLWLDIAESKFARAFMRQRGGPRFQGTEFDPSDSDSMEAYQHAATRWLVYRLMHGGKHFKAGSLVFGAEAEKVPVSTNKRSGEPARELSTRLIEMRKYGIEGELVVVAKPHTTASNDTLQAGQVGIKFTVPFGPPTAALLLIAD